MFRRQLAKARCADLVTEVQSESARAAKRRRYPIGLLFIDADHHYRPCRRDYLAWQRFVPVGGWIAFHDYTPRYGVKRVIDEVVRPSGFWANEAVHDRLWSAQRVR